MKHKSRYLDATLRVHERLKGTRLDTKALDLSAADLKLLSRFFGADVWTSAFLCSVVQLSLLDGETEVKAVADHLGIDRKMFGRIVEAMEDLCEAGLADARDRNFDRPRRLIAPTPRLMEALLRGDKSKLKPAVIEGIGDFFAEYDRLAELKKKGHISCHQYSGQLMRLCRRSKELAAIGYFSSLALPGEELLMLLYIAKVTFQGADIVEVADAIRQITESQGDFYEWSMRFRRQDLRLFSEDLIEFCFFELGMDTEVSLTQRAREVLFAGKSREDIPAFRPTLGVLMHPEKIHHEDLLFEDRTRTELDSLRALLMPDAYARLGSQLKEKQMKGGLTILLHGPPGTGKTASVYQLARATGRAILRLEISKVKAMWVGESEKNLKKLFIEYRRLRRSLSADPILLFNEADAIFSRRRNVSTSVDQMENSLQNILLQELEEFDGILVATTNLTGNFDPAFDRRFLYRIPFSPPGAVLRAQLLKKAFPEVSDDHAAMLAGRNNFTGSNVENIRRKATLAELLGKEVRRDMNSLGRLLDEECSPASQKPVIGFRIGGL